MVYISLCKFYARLLRITLASNNSIVCRASPRRKCGTKRPEIVSTDTVVYLDYIDSDAGLRRRSLYLLSGAIWRFKPPGDGCCN